MRSSKFSTIDELLALLKAIGRRIVEANPKGTPDLSLSPQTLPHRKLRLAFRHVSLHTRVSDRADFPELASGNIIRRILRLIREEYRAAAAAHVSAPSSVPSTPYLGPETPGLHAPANHYLSNEFAFSSPNSNPVGLPRQPSLSNFVAMRHSRAQLERQGSLLEMSSTTTNLFTTPTRTNSIDAGLGGGAGSPGGAYGAGLSRQDSEEFMKQSGRLKPVLIQAIEEVVGELETTHEDVAKGAREHIHSS